MTLQTPIYDVRSSYCGPTAIAAITGHPISVIKETIREISGHRMVTGVSNKDLLAAMAKLGWCPVETVETENEHYSHRDLFKLGDFLDAHGDRGPFIVNVTGHYIAVSHGEVCDTATKLPIDIKKWRKAKPGRWVKRWWRFELQL